VVVKSKNKIHSQVNTNIQLERECYILKPMSIFLEILFLFGLIIYIVYVFVIKKDYSVSRIIIFAILLLSFVINVINMLYLFFQ
jgi:hypothetical protein